jgi:hypothetical protein
VPIAPSRTTSAPLAAFASQLGYRPPAAIPTAGAANVTAFTVHSSGDQIATLAEKSRPYVKQVLCTDFGFYVQTGRVVPTPEELVQLVAKQVLSKVLTGPPAVQFRDKVESVRQAILSAKNEDEAGRNAAIAAVCAFT